MSQRNKQIRDGNYQRTFTLERAGVDIESRSVSAALSSEAPVTRWFGNEILSHDADAVDLARASEGLPLLFGHDHKAPIGLVENVHIGKDRKLRGTLRFSNNATADQVWGDVREGFLKDVSIGYDIRKWEEQADSEDVNVTRWAVHEASIVSVPADHTVGINRSYPTPTTTEQEDNPMPIENDGSPAAPNGDGQRTVVDFDQARVAGQQEGHTAGVIAERQRLADITNVFELDSVRSYAATSEGQALRQSAITEGWSADQVRSKILSSIGSGTPVTDNPTDTQIGAGRGHVSAGQDSVEKMSRGISDALAVRAGHITDREQVREINANEFRGMTISEMARRCLDVRGIATAGLSRDALMSKALTTRAGSMTSGDFPAILENIANKAALMGWDEAPVTWNQIARAGSLSDFRQATRVNINAAGNLELIDEDGEYKHDSLRDRKEPIQLLTYGKKARISRVALVNDDMDILTRLPQAYGAAGARKVNQIVYAILTANAALTQDSTTLFHANHNNLGTAGAISVTTVDELRVLMALQTDADAANTTANADSLNLPMDRLIVPKTLESAARVLSTATFDPNTSNDTQTPNPVAGFQVVADALLDADDTAQWYASVNPQVFDTIEVAFLDGQAEPYIDQMDDWDTDGVELKVRVDAAAAALDFRGLARNAGA